MFDRSEGRRSELQFVVVGLHEREVPIVQRVDVTTCVLCGKKEYSPSAGRSSRSFSGVCGDHPAEDLNARSASASAADGSPSQSKGVSSRSQGQTTKSAG